jgi:hypothetical protein
MQRLVWALAVGLALSTAVAAQPICGPDYYRNVSGHCVHRPEQSNERPLGATARCRDGTYSFSEHRRGTCSHHGGVATWL